MPNRPPRDLISLLKRSIWVTDWPLWVVPAVWVIALIAYFNVPKDRATLAINLGEVIDYPSLLAMHTRLPDYVLPLCIGVALIPLIYGLCRYFLRERNWPRLLPLLALLPLCACNGLFCLGTVFVPSDGTSLTTKQTLPFAENTYHLATADTVSGGGVWFTREYIIYQCDAAGITCRAIHQQQDSFYMTRGISQAVWLEVNGEALYLHISQEVTQLVP